MGYLMKRFKGHRKNLKDRRNGGIGAFTPDNMPVVDWIMPNAYMIADSNHGFKMTGVGKRSEEHTSELQSLMRISYAVFCLNKKTVQHNRPPPQPPITRDHIYQQLRHP